MEETRSFLRKFTDITQQNIYFAPKKHLDTIINNPYVGENISSEWMFDHVDTLHSFFQDKNARIPREYLQPDLSKLLKTQKELSHTITSTRKSLEKIFGGELEITTPQFSQIWKAVVQNNYAEKILNTALMKNKFQELSFNILMKGIPSELKKTLLYPYAGNDTSVKHMNFSEYIFIDQSYDENKQKDDIVFLKNVVGTDPFPEKEGVLYIQPGSPSFFNIIAEVPLNNIQGIIYTSCEGSMLHQMNINTTPVRKSFKALKKNDFKEIILPLEYYDSKSEIRFDESLRLLFTIPEEQKTVPEIPKNFNNVHLFLKK